MIATVDISVQAANPSMPLFPMRTFAGSPSSIRVRNVPKKIGDWAIDKVYFSVAYPDNSNQTIECKLVGGVYVGTVSGCSATGSVKNGYSIFADGKDENGNAVTDYCLGKGDVQVLDARGITHPLQNTTFVQILSARPTNPNDGDMWYENDAWFVWQNGQALPLGDDSATIGNLSDRVDDLASDVDDLSEDIDGTNNRIDGLINGDTNVLNSYYAYNLYDSGTGVEKSANSIFYDLSQKADASSLNNYATKAELANGSVIAKKADGATSSEKLVHSLSDEHSTRIIVDEHDNVIVQKYVQSGWYVENVKVRVGAGDYVDTTDYWVKVNVETTADGLVFDWTFQDYARTLKTGHRSYTNSDTSVTTLTFVDGWYASETGGQAISLEMHFAYSATPIWVNISRLVPDGSTQSGLRAAQIAADGSFVTPDQVEPLGWMHYAKGARDTLYMYQPNAQGGGQNRNKWVQIHPSEGKLIMVDSAYPSWFLSKYNGTTIDPPIEMKWGYHTTTTYYNRRIKTLQINSWGWVATSLYPQTGTTRNRFYIKANVDDDGWIESIDDKFYVSTTAHDITLSSDYLSVETFDGSTDLVECTRASYAKIQSVQYYAVMADLETGLSTKADVSSLNNYELKADLPNDVSAIVAPLESELDDKLDFNISNANAWYPGDYSKGDICTYNGILYKYVYDAQGQYEPDNPEENNHWLPCSFASTSALSTKQDALTNSQLDAVNSGITSDKVAQIGTWQYPFVDIQASEQPPTWNYSDYDTTAYNVGSGPTFDTSLGVWHMYLIPVANPEDVFILTANEDEQATTLHFSGDSTHPVTLTATQFIYQQIDVFDYKNNNLSASNFNPSLPIQLGSIIGGNTRMGDFYITIDGSSMSGDLDMIFTSYYPQIRFHPKTSTATDFSCKSGSWNVFHITEYRESNYVVERWIET